MTKASTKIRFLLHILDISSDEPVIKKDATGEGFREIAQQDQHSSLEVSPHWTTTVRDR